MRGGRTAGLIRSTTLSLARVTDNDGSSATDLARVTHDAKGNIAVNGDFVGPAIWRCLGLNGFARLVGMMKCEIHLRLYTATSAFPVMISHNVVIVVVTAVDGILDLPREQ